MKIRLLALVLVGSTACRTSDAASEVKHQTQSGTAARGYPAAEDQDKSAAYSGSPVKGAGISPAAQPDADLPPLNDKESLLKWRVGRWSLVLKGTEAVETLDKAGSVACEVTVGKVKSQFGKDKVVALKAAIAEAFKVRDQRQISPIFRGLDQSRELIAVLGGQEFLIEKMYQSRDAIMPDPSKNVGRDIPKPGAAESGLELIMEVAVNPTICPTVPN